MADLFSDLDPLLPFLYQPDYEFDELGQFDGGDNSRNQRRKYKHNEDCKKSRKRIKLHKELLTSKIEMLSGEVNELKEKDEELRLADEKLSLDLHVLKNKKEELENQIGNMKETIARHKKNEDELLEHLEGQKPESKIVELERLKNECRVLDPNANWLNWESEKLELEKKIEEEEKKNRLLKAQRNAVYGMRLKWG